MPDPKWIRFEEDTPPAWKTKAWRVVNTQHGAFLGWVKWWGGWRRYCFFPGDGTIFEQDCLRDIAEFCEAKTREHKEKKEAANDSR